MPRLEILRITASSSEAVDSWTAYGYPSDDDAIVHDDDLSWVVPNFVRIDVTDSMTVDIESLAGVDYRWTAGLPGGIASPESIRAAAPSHITFSLAMLDKYEVVFRAVDGNETVQPLEGTVYVTDTELGSTVLAGVENGVTRSIWLRRERSYDVRAFFRDGSAFFKQLTGLDRAGSRVVDFNTDLDDRVPSISVVKPDGWIIKKVLFELPESKVKGASPIEASGGEGPTFSPLSSELLQVTGLPADWQRLWVLNQDGQIAFAERSNDTGAALPMTQIRAEAVKIQPRELSNFSDDDVVVIQYQVSLPFGVPGSWVSCDVLRMKAAELPQVWTKYLPVGCLARVVIRAPGKESSSVIDIR